jgi:hypothetical protein
LRQTAFEVDRPTPDQMRHRRGMAVAYYLHHDLSHQKPIRKEDWPPLFAAAGFSVKQRRDLGFARSVCFELV